MPTFQLELTSPLFISFASIFVVSARFLQAYPRLFEWLIFSFNLMFLFLISHHISNLILIIALAGLVIALAELRFSLLSESGFFALSVVMCLWILLFVLKDADIFVIPWALPKQGAELIAIVGISYFIFRCISYFSDVEVIEQRSFIKSLNYLLFFPTVLAGPIIRYEDYAQRAEKETDWSVTLEALHQIVNGYIKKFIFADLLSPAGIFSKGTEHWSLSMLWIGVSLQLFILYLDFSGYCDIMIGLAKLAGFRLPANFNYPFLSANIQEFWTRWHITLGGFIKDYVFNPLFRFGLQTLPPSSIFALTVATYFFTMLLIALWHKVSLGFLIFGLIQATALVLFLLKKKYFPTKSPSIIKLRVAQVFTYFLVSFSMIFWYYGPKDALGIIAAMFGF
ncbi:hypothetical protein BH10PSE19_BH10PSE19_08350 [soil metagenome]